MPRQDLAEGDIIEWKGVNKIHHGRVIKKGDTFICKMENGCSFQLSDLRYGKSTKLIKQ